MDCPTCHNDDTEYYETDEDYYRECNTCNCSFADDGEILTKWQYCAECGNYVAPEDKPRHGDPVCQRCTR